MDVNTFLEMRVTTKGQGAVCKQLPRGQSPKGSPIERYIASLGPNESFKDDGRILLASGNHASYPQNLNRQELDGMSV